MTFTITREYLYLGVTIVLLLIQVWQMFKIDALKKEIDNIWNQIHIIAISAGNTLQKLEKKIDEKQDKQ
jgi:lysozyme family protein